MVLNNSINILTTPEIIKIHIDEFNTSKERQLMLKGEKYYKVENDILNRQMIRYENEKPVNDETKANNKLAHGFMYMLVDDKINYLLVKPYTLECDDENYLKLVQETLGKRFQKKLKQLGTEASNKGIAWLYPYIDSEGNFKTMKIPSEQGIPIWLDNDHEELQAFIRYYDVETYEGKEKKIVTKIEYHTSEGIQYYVMDQNGNVILDAEAYLEEEGEDITIPHFEVRKQPGTWEKVPFIPFKNNDFELPDLQFIKTLIDNYDLTRSDNANELEDFKNFILALRGYGGESLSEFMRDLSYYRAVKLDADENAGLNKIETPVNIDSAEKHYQQLKKDIYEFGQGVDKSSDKLGNSPSGIALKFMYSGLDLKCNAIEENFKWAFEQLLYFVNKYLELTGKKVSDKEVTLIFNRDIAINESGAITDCMNSKGVISDKTIVANHPWVTDLDEELKQIEKETKSSEPPMFNDGEGDE
jgi:SPP1 family phage portal protein